MGRSLVAALSVGAASPLRLRDLRVSGCGVGDDGLCAIASAMERGRLPALVRLDAARVGAGERGLSAVARGVAAAARDMDAVSLDGNRSSPASRAWIPLLLARVSEVGVVGQLETWWEDLVRGAPGGVRATLVRLSCADAGAASRARAAIAASASANVSAGTGVRVEAWCEGRGWVIVD